MKTYAIITMKGGAGKTISSINIAHILNAKYGKNVLLIDADKQGNVSKFFGIYGGRGLAEVLTEDIPAAGTIKQTPYKGLDILPTNMSLLSANREILLDITRPQHTRLKDALTAGVYDYCIIDCAPDINMATINALTLADAVLIPIKVDKFSIDGLGELLEQIDSMACYNPKLYVAGCFVTMYRNNDLNRSGYAYLCANSPVHVFNTYIRDSISVGKGTFPRKGEAAARPLLKSSPTCNATKDYINLVGEILDGNII